MLGALLGLVVAAGPLPPPIFDGEACRDWVIAAANRLALAPQPTVTALPEAGEGLADIPLAVWEKLETFHRDLGPEASRRRMAVLEGNAGLDSAPELVAAARQLQPEIQRVLHAARSSRNRLPDSLQIWDILGGGKPSTLSVQNPGILGIILSRQALAAGDASRAASLCLENWALNRTFAGTGLIGQMIAATNATPLRSLCLEAARRLPGAQRAPLYSGLRVLRDDWPSFGSTLEQELVFSQTGFYSTRWDQSSVARLPAAAIRLRTEIHANDDPTWLEATRWRVFGRWAGHEDCLLQARAILSADAAPQIADPVLLAAGKRPLVLKLAKAMDGESSWVGLARRMRAARAQLEVALTVLEAWDRGPAGSRRTDPRTAKPFEVEVTGNQVVVLGRADPEIDVSELRLVIGDATTPP